MTITTITAAIAIGTVGLLPLHCDADQDGIIDCDLDRDGVATFHVDDPIDCDLDAPVRLDITFGPFAGGDAELVAADTLCQDMGGVPFWDNGTWLRCEAVDY